MNTAASDSWFGAAAWLRNTGMDYGDYVAPLTFLPFSGLPTGAPERSGTAWKLGALAPLC